VILADTSIWVEHLRKGGKSLADLLDAGMIVTHPFVIGEIALGSLARRDLILSMLEDLPRATVATDSEVRNFIETHSLFGRGIGYIDAHLLAAARLTQGSRLWTGDKRLQSIAKELDLAFGNA
jgi:predicted nucleic acid-binding protein